MERGLSAVPELDLRFVALDVFDRAHPWTARSASLAQTPFWKSTKAFARRSARMGGARGAAPNAGKRSVTAYVLGTGVAKPAATIAARPAESPSVSAPAKAKGRVARASRPLSQKPIVPARRLAAPRRMRACRAIAKRDAPTAPIRRRGRCCRARSQRRRGHRPSRLIDGNSVARNRPASPPAGRCPGKSAGARWCRSRAPPLARAPATSARVASRDRR